MSQAVIEQKSPRWKRVTTFTTTGNDAKIGDGSAIMKNFALQVVPTGAVTSWSVYLKGSLDGVNFTTILTHSNTSPGANEVRFDGDIISPCLYYRIECGALALGGGTDIVVTALGL